MQDQETSKINRYLLGELPSEEASALEARLLTESGLFELAEAVEDEVVDRYVRGEMPREEARRFERRLLPSERIRERVAFARTLAAHGTAAPGRRREEAGGRVIPLFRSPARLAWAATLVAVLAAGVLAIEVIRLRDEAGALERAHGAAVARLEETQRSEPTPPSVEAREESNEAARLAEELSDARERIAELEAREAATTERRVRRPREIGEDAATRSLFLSLVTRGAEPGTLQLGEADRYELQLDLGNRRPGGPIAATVLREGQPVWKEIELPVETFDGEAMALLKLPRELLLAGRYRIELTDETDRLVAPFEFSVTP